MVNTTDGSLILSASQLWNKSIATKKIKESNKNQNSIQRVDDNFNIYTNTIIFPYILFRGVYRIQFHVCDEKSIQAENYENDDGDIR